MMPAKESTQSLNIIGSTEYVGVAGIKNIPAKIDTGADSSSIWASNINMREDGILTFSLFDEKSDFYTGEILETNDYMVKTVRSSHGDKQIRYRVELPLSIDGESFVTAFTLADRSRNNFPILIGRRTISGRFLVDVSKSSVQRAKNQSTSRHLNEELKKDPYAFHRKYLKERS